MGLLSDHRFAKIDNDLIIVSAEINADSPKGAFKLIQNGIILDTQYKMFGNFSLSGKAGRDIEVKIKLGIFGTKYQLFVNGIEHQLIKTTEAEAIKMMEEKGKQVLAEVRNIDKSNAKIFPILKPGNWNGLNFSAHQVMLGDKNDPLLVIAYGYNLPGSFSFISNKDLESRSLEEINAEAKNNIDERHVKIEKSDNLPDPILLASGDDFSAEKILSKSFLLEAQSLLGAEELLISIPRRRCMMIGNRKASAQTLEMFTQLHLVAWNEDNYGNAQIYNGLFIAKDGELQGVIPLQD